MQTISTRNLAPIPDIPALRRLTQLLAMLDAILCPEWEERYYSLPLATAEAQAVVLTAHKEKCIPKFCFFSISDSVLELRSHSPFHRS
jgi:hypothetical protein